MLLFSETLIDEAYLYYPMESKEGDKILGINSPSMTEEGSPGPVITAGRQNNGLLLENHAYVKGSPGIRMQPTETQTFCGEQKGLRRFLMS